MVSSDLSKMICPTSSKRIYCSQKRVAGSDTVPPISLRPSLCSQLPVSASPHPREHLLRESTFYIYPPFLIQRMLSAPRQLQHPFLYKLKPMSESQFPSVPLCTKHSDSAGEDESQARAGWVQVLLETGRFVEMTPKDFVMEKVPHRFCCVCGNKWA